jgi:hypothetical protein
VNYTGLEWLSGSESGIRGSSDGPPILSRFNSISGISTMIYQDQPIALISDTLNFNIRSVNSINGYSNTIAGNASSPPASIDGIGLSARFYWNQIQCLDPFDNILYINQDHDRNSWRIVNPLTRAVSTMKLHWNIPIPIDYPVSCTVSLFPSSIYAVFDTNIYEITKRESDSADIDSWEGSMFIQLDRTSIITNRLISMAIDNSQVGLVVYIAV